MVILTVLAILSALALARFPDNFARTRAVYDELLAQVQFARKTAIAQRRVVCVAIGAGQSQLVYGDASGCPGPGVAGPTGDLPFTVEIPANVNVTSSTFQFDALGRYRTSAGALAGSQLALSVTGDGAYQIVVWHDTGYVQ